MGSRVGNAGVRVRNGRSPRSNFYPGLTAGKPALYWDPGKEICIEAH